MALLNLSYVTQSLKRLIEAYFSESEEWNASLTVSPKPPDQLQKETNTIGLYLYHVSEDSHFKNAVNCANPSLPVRYTPMGLSLYYQLSAHHQADNETAVYQEQLMMGLAMKAFRDYSTIDDTTKLLDKYGQPVKKNGKTIKLLVLELEGKGNRFNITLQPIPPNEAVSYWTAGSTPMRLAAYYQVTAVLLEPEEPQSRAGRVLTYGTYADVYGIPHLYGTHNVIAFTDPKGHKNEIELRPAQAPPAPAASVPEESLVVLSGTHLIRDKTTLILKNSLWDEPVEVKDASWSVKAKDNQVNAIISEDVGGKKVLPGIYAALVKVSSEREMPDGSKRGFDYTTNETPFVVSPRLDTITGPDAQNLVKVDGFIFKYEITDPQTGTKKNLVSLQVYVNDIRLRLAKTVANLKQGEYGIHEPPPPQAPQLHLRLPKPQDLPPPLNYGGDNYQPLRVLVNGAESQPRWTKV
jgi:hypothetical protein